MGDQDWIRSCCAAIGGRENCDRHPEIISWGQPRWCIRPIRVRTDDQVEKLRTLRNECREWMTRSRDEISPEQQSVWWSSYHRLAWLYELEQEVVGYSLLYYEDSDIATLSYGLTESARGQGVGKQVMYHTLIAAHGPAWVEVLASNESSLRAHESLGWKRVKRNGNIHCFYHSGITDSLIDKVGL